jgi:hypothetical protein
LVGQCQRWRKAHGGQSERRKELWKEPYTHGCKRTRDWAKGGKLSGAQRRAGPC